MDEEHATESDMLHFLASVIRFKVTVTAIAGSVKFAGSMMCFIRRSGVESYPRNCPEFLQSKEKTT
jgi:hypothetical protein